MKTSIIGSSSAPSNICENGTAACILDSKTDSKSKNLLRLLFNCIIQCYWINRYIAWFSTVWWGNIFQKEEIYSKKREIYSKKMKYIPKEEKCSKKRKYIPKRWIIFQKEEIYSKKWKYIFQNDEIYSKQKKYIPKRGMLLRSVWTAGIAMHCWCLVKMYFFYNFWQITFYKLDKYVCTSHTCVWWGDGKNLGTKPAPSQGL